MSMLVFRLITLVVGVTLPIFLEAVRTGKPIVEQVHFDLMLVYLASPFLVLAGLSWLMKSRWPLGVALVALIASSCYSWYAVSKSTSSTAALGILATPLYELFVVLPVTLLGTLLLERLTKHLGLRRSP